MKMSIVSVKLINLNSIFILKFILFPIILANSSQRIFRRVTRFIFTNLTEVYICSLLFTSHPVVTVCKQTLRNVDIFINCPMLRPSLVAFPQLQSVIAQRFYICHSDFQSTVFLLPRILQHFGCLIQRRESHC